MQCELNQLRDGETASITEIDADEALYYRLHALGFRTGQPITVMRHGILKGPLQVSLGTTQVIIRRKDAARIKVRRAA
jgi:ferrous iron transport protein A